MSLFKPECPCKAEFEELERNLSFQLRCQRMMLYDILAESRTNAHKLDKCLAKLDEILILLTPRPSALAVTFGGPMPLLVGATSTATLVVLDQNGQPITGFDFVANPPAWSVVDATLVTIAPNATIPGAEDFTGVAPGTVNWSVVCAGLTATGSFSVAAAAPVPTSLQVTFNPPVA